MVMDFSPRGGRPAFPLPPANERAVSSALVRSLCLMHPLWAWDNPFSAWAGGDGRVAVIRAFGRHPEPALALFGGDGDQSHGRAPTRRTRGLARPGRTAESGAAFARRSLAATARRAAAQAAHLARAAQQRNAGR